MHKLQFAIDLIQIELIFLTKYEIFINELLSTKASIEMDLFTVGKILIFPSNSLLIDQLAGEQLRGIYFGASLFRKIGNFVGPIIRGIFLNYTGGKLMFLIITIMTLGSIFFFTLWSRIPSKNIN